jgi:TM2 domain-containing membrane protein YozV
MVKWKKAAWLSALLFPGVGHLYLKAYIRGSILLLVALISVYVIISIAVQRALAIVEIINSGELPVDSTAVTELLSQTASSADDLTVNVSTMIFGVCWLIGIVDSYRTGKAQQL